MKQMIYVLWMTVAGVLLGAVPVEAFPGWIGVYGSTPRHNGVNPGQFMILMDEDYFGLEANVGLRVNDGDWQEFPMAYQTNLAGNSVWTYASTEPFPFGSKIEYYFHGYEGDNHIYDNADAVNYHSGPLFWSEPHDTELVSSYPGNSYGQVQICSLNRDLIGAQAMTVLQMRRKPVGCDWQPLNYPSEDTGITDFAMAGNEGELVVACMIDTNLTARTSVDSGETFSPPVPLGTEPADADFSGLSVAAGAPGEFGVVYGLSTNCCGAQQQFFTQSTNNGLTWSEPIVVMELGEGAYFDWLELGHNSDGWFLAARSVYQGSSLLMYCARSTNGVDWTMDSLGGNRVWNDPDLCLSSNVAAIAADPYYDDYTRVWRYQSGGWSTQDISRTLESGRTVRLGTDDLGSWYVFRQVDNNEGWLWSSFLSLDDAQTWTPSRAFLNPEIQNDEDQFTLEQVLNVGPKQYLLWHCNYYIGTYQRMHEAQLQKSDGYDERLDDILWNGANFTVVVTNVAPGASNHLECSESFVNPVWTNIYTWRGDEPATNWAGTATTQGCFRIRIEH